MSQDASKPDNRFQVRRWLDESVDAASYSARDLRSMVADGRIEPDDWICDERRRFKRVGKEAQLVGADRSARYRALDALLSHFQRAVRAGSIGRADYAALRDRVLGAPDDGEARHELESRGRSLGLLGHGSTMIGESGSGTLVGEGGVDAPTTLVGEGEAVRSTTLVGSDEDVVATARALNPGDQVNDGTEARYRVEELVGRGGQGSVYRVKDVDLGSIKAIKIQDPAQSANPELRRRFMQEGRASNDIISPNVVRVDDAKRDASRGIVYLVMEFVAGGSLRDVIARNPKGVPVDEALGYFRDLLAGLAAVHERGQTHKDIKPENLLIATQGGRRVLKIADLGLAGLGEAKGAVGTLRYMAPEQQTSAASVTPSADLYSAGKILHELLTGRRPQLGGASLGELCPAARYLVSVFQRLVQESPEDRFQSCAEVRDALDEAERLREMPAQRRGGTERLRIAPVRTLEQRGEDGDPDALRELAAQRLAPGMGAAARAEGLKLMALAADRGDATAMEDLIRRLEHGDGMLRDEVQAKIWSRRLAAMRADGSQGLSMAAGDTVRVEDWCPGQVPTSHADRGMRIELEHVPQRIPEYVAFGVAHDHPVALLELGSTIVEDLPPPDQPVASSRRGQRMALAAWAFRAAGRAGLAEAYERLTELCLRTDYALADGEHHEPGQDGSNVVQANQWARLGAELGSAACMCRAAEALFDAEGRIPQESIGKYYEWIDGAAAKGHPRALGIRGHGLLNEWGMQRTTDREEGLRCLRQGGDLGDGYCNYALGMWHLGRDGGEHEPAEAARRLEAAHRAGVVEATVEYAWCLIDGVGVRKHPMHARELLEACVENPGGPRVQVGIARCMIDMRGVVKAPVEAAAHLQLAVAQGDHWAMYLLGWLADQRRERGLPVDEATYGNTASLYLRAAQGGVTAAMYPAGRWLLEQGAPPTEDEGSPVSARAKLQDRIRGRQMLERFIASAERGAERGEAQFLVASCVETGVGGPANPALALDLFVEAAGQGSVRACTHLAKMYLGGKHVQRALGEARRWCDEAARLGLPKEKVTAMLAAIAERSPHRHRTQPAPVSQSIESVETVGSVEPQTGPVDSIAPEPSISAPRGSNGLLQVLKWLFVIGIALLILWVLVWALTSPLSTVLPFLLKCGLFGVVGLLVAAARKK